MGMLERFSVTDIPFAETPDAARPLLQRYAATDLPAVIVYGFTVNTLAEALAQLGPDIPDTMSTRPLTTIDLEFGDLGKLGHLGLHVDYRRPKPKVSKIHNTYHLTHSGHAGVVLLPTGDNAEVRPITGEFREELEAQVLDGQVNTGLFVPECHQGELKPGALLAFKNGASYWHWMNTLGTGRRSTAFDAWMETTPGMNLTYYSDPSDRY